MVDPQSHMPDPKKMIAESYDGMLQRINELSSLVAIQKVSVMDVLIGLQTACLSQLRKAHHIIQTQLPPEQRRSFAQFLREASELLEKSEGEDRVNYPDEKGGEGKKQ